jgi:hypothetical protein
VTSAEKTKYRKTVEWKRFRKSVLKSDCELCGCRSKKPRLHHTDPDRYDTLEPELFVTLCSTCHRFIHHHARKKALSPEIRELVSRFFV